MNKKLNIFHSRLRKEKVILQEAEEKADNVKEYILDIDRQFEEATGLDKKDRAFLLTAIALQLVRQYVLGTILSKRLPHDKAAEKIEEKEKKWIKDSGLEKLKGRKHRYYNPSLAEVICYPVSFDANIGSNGILKGGGNFGHRAKTAGHDPILGLVFGTANIATSTITILPNFKSYHVISGKINGRNYSTVIGNKAKTRLVLKYTIKKVQSKKPDQMAIVAAALIKEVNHLRSDIHSKNSLPMPFASAISPDMANELAKVGLDAANLEKLGAQAGTSIFINTIIAMLHRLCYDEKEIDKDLFMVKTKKIINYSNIIASSSNVIAVAIGSFAALETGNPELIKKILSYIDFAGITAAVCTFLKDSNNVYEIKREFMKNEWYKAVKGEV